MAKQFVGAMVDNMLLSHQANGGESGVFTGVNSAGTHGNKGTISRELVSPITGTSSWKYTVTNYLVNEDCNLTFIQATKEDMDGYPVYQNVSYDFEASVKAAPGTAQITLRIIEWTATGGVAKDNTLHLVNNPTGVVRLKGTMVPQSTTKRVSIRVRCDGSGVHIIDDLVFRRTPIPNPAINPFANLVPLFTDPAWVKHANATASADGKTLELKPVAAWQSSSWTANVPPNTAFQVGGKMTATNGVANISVYAVPSNQLLKAVRSDDPAGASTVFTTPAGVVQIRIWCETNQSSGTFTFSNLTLCRVQPSNPFANLVPLFTDAAWNRHANASVSADGKMLTLAATGTFQGSKADIVIPPYTTVVLAVDITGAGAVIESGSLTYTELDWSVHFLDAPAPGRYTKQFVTAGASRKVRIWLQNNATGTFTFSNLTLWRVNDDFFKELVVNGDFSQGGAGWSIHASSSVTGGQLVQNATAGYQYTSQVIPNVLPSTTYVLAQGEASAPNQVTLLREQDEKGNTIFDNYMGPTSKVITTSPLTRKALIMLGCNVAGTYTFDNISLKRATAT